MIPNEKLVSETLRNSTIRNERPLAEVTVQHPARAPTCAPRSPRSSRDADEVVVSRPRRAGATIAVRRVVKDGERIERAQSELRLEVAERLREAGITRRRGVESGMARRRASSDVESPGRSHYSRRRKRIAAAAPPAPHRACSSPRSSCGLVVVVAVAGFGAGAALSASCNLSSLKPVDIGANTFVYAADGSLLGSIPAERNREPVPLAQHERRGCRRRRSPSRTSASTSTAASTTSGSCARSGRDVSAGKVVEGGSTITQQLVRNMYTGREQTFDRKIKEACLAIKLSDRWSKHEDPRRPT